MEENAKREELKELKKDVLEIEPHVLKVEKPIIYDKRQYSVRIPMRFAKVLKLNQKDKFRFVLDVPSATARDNEPKLRGELIRVSA